MFLFANPLFLIALVGLVAPILIHRISRARPRPWNFPSISRIRRVPLPRQGQRTISDWLLLLLRMLLFALLIFALADPTLQPKADAAASQSRIAGEAVILIDHSASIAGWNAQEDIVSRLNELREQVAADTALGVVVFTDDIELTIAPDPSRSVGTVLDETRSYLRTNPPKTVTGNPERGLIAAMALMSESGLRQLHILSDFQLNDWQISLPTIPDAIELALHTVGMESRDRNIAVQRVQALPAENDQLRIVAELMNFSGQTEAVSAVLHHAENRYPQPIEIAGMSSVTVGWNINIDPQFDDARIGIEAESDPYSLDNDYVFRASEPPPLDLFSLMSSGAADDGDEVFFVEQALAVATGFEWLNFSMTQVGHPAINPQTLQRAGAVFVPAGAAADPETRWDILSDYIREGGLVITTLASNAVFPLQRMRVAGIDPGNYIGMAAREIDRRQRQEVGDIPRQSLLAEVFSGPAARDLYLLDLREFSLLEPHPNAEALLITERGAPLLIQLRHGKGNLIVSTFPWNMRASDLPLRPSFLPIVRELLSLAPATRNPVIRLNTHQAIPLAEADSTQPDLPSTAQPAAFRFRGATYEVNIDRAESNPAIISPEAIAARLRGGADPRQRAARMQIADTGTSDTRSLAPWLFLAALIAWIVESFLAARLSRDRA